MARYVLVNRTPPQPKPEYTDLSEAVAMLREIQKASPELDVAIIELVDGLDGEPPIVRDVVVETTRTVDVSTT